MIGLWDETGCVAAWMWAAHTNGNGVNQYQNYYAAYPSANMRMEFKNFGAGEGYVAAQSKIIVPGVNEYGIISDTQQLWHIDFPISIEMIAKPQITLGASGIEIITLFKDFSVGGHAIRLMFMDTAQYPTYKGLALTVGANNAKFGYGTRATFHDTKRHIALTYNGAGVNTIGNWALYLGGSPVALASFAGASIVANGVNYLFTNNPVGFYGEMNMEALLVYNVELSAARVATNAGLGDDYGLKGINVGDLMNLTAKGGGGRIMRGVGRGINRGLR